MQRLFDFVLGVAEEEGRGSLPVDDEVPTSVGAYAVREDTSLEASTFEVVFAVRRIDYTSICYYASAVCVYVLGRLTCELLVYAIF